MVRIRKDVATLTPDERRIFLQAFVAMKLRPSSDPHSFDNFVRTHRIAALGKAGTVAVVLPGAYYFVRETQGPPVAALRAQGVPIALATDCNPGTSPLTSLLLTLNMAATLFRLTVEECLAGVTRNAARALGLSRWHMMRKVILPQAMRAILPALANQSISVIKGTAVASA